MLVLRIATTARGDTVTDRPTTRLDCTEDSAGVPALAAHDASSRGDLAAALQSTDEWSEGLLASSGIPVIDSPLVSIGGGIGSFVVVDYLRIASVPASPIRVLSGLDYPWQTYEYLTELSQIPAGERLRSDSSFTPDNIWGFRSHAVREAFSACTVREFFAPLSQVLTKPILADYYTPRAGQVLQTLGRESARIDYPRMQVKGMVRMVRRRRGGGYFSLLTPPVGTSATVRVAYRSDFVHIALGYPGFKRPRECQTI